MSEDDESSGWQLTESDPGVFTELLKKLGVPLQVDDLYSLDDEILATMQPIYALIFLFKWIAGADEKGGAEGTYDEDFPGFFAHQVVNNACATLAVLNGLGNIPNIPKGEELGELLSFTAGMDPQTTGLAITSSTYLRAAHNSLSPPSAISLDGLGLPKTTEEAYHFVVYLPYLGSLYELDGLKRYPVKHGHVDGEGWLGKARDVINSRIATYPPGSIHFNLQALRADPLPRLQTQLEEHRGSGATSLAHQVEHDMAIELEKRKRWDFENSLRRHNHTGLVHALLLGLAKTAKLDEATEKAREKMKERRQKIKEGKMNEDW
ncbi:ubiquitin carboxyl-terminal hydrolase [Hysterangium stoloniferum]|nr:ubiquitin carboxyl-terminal hydrolase [Hysterangium stoloniferum]